MTDRMEVWKKATDALREMLDAADQIEMADIEDIYVEQIVVIRKLCQDIRAELHEYIRPDLEEQPK